MSKLSTSLIALMAVGLSGTAAWAEDAQNLGDAISNGDASLAFRYRLENVSQDGVDKDATASTLRTLISYKTQAYKGFSGFLQVENVSVVGNTTYNNTLNGKTQYPVIADPASTELNQAYLSYKADNGFSLTAGRVALNLGNQRFVGTVGFRQNDQTFDLVSLGYKNGNLSATYGYVWQVNRIFSSKHALGQVDTDTHVFNVDYKLKDLGTLTGYALLIDMENPALAGLSSDTYGVRFAGKTAVSDGVNFVYQAEYANQGNYVLLNGLGLQSLTTQSSDPSTSSTDYALIEAGLSSGGFTGAVGYEMLGSNNNGKAFGTPLATLHKFNGWADKFLGTPSGGINDTYAKFVYKAPKDGKMAGTTFMVFYHDFNSDVGGVDYGSEIDWKVSKPFGGRYSVSLEGAHYNASAFSTDTTKVWFTLGAKF